MSKDEGTVSLDLDKDGKPDVILRLKGKWAYILIPAAYAAGVATGGFL